jgi:hypothetical protein
MLVTLFRDFSTYRYLQYLQIQTRYWQIPTGNSDKIPTNSTVGNQGICKYMHVSVGIYHYFEKYLHDTYTTYLFWLSVSIWQLSVSIFWMGAVCASKVGCVSKERLRKPIRGTLTQIWFYSHSLFKWQGQGSHWARPWPTCWCRTGDIHHRLWGWQVHALCSNLALAVMGWVHIIRVHIVMNTAQRHCHSKCQCA